VYGAHTGAVDALWAGKPLLTCLGPKCSTLIDSRQQTPGSHEAHLGADCMTARIASSMLVGSGLEEVREIRTAPSAACHNDEPAPADAQSSIGVLLFLRESQSSRFLYPCLVGPWRVSGVLCADVERVMGRTRMRSTW
jgi:hypothetical protein